MSLTDDANDAFPASPVVSPPPWLIPVMLFAAGVIAFGLYTGLSRLAAPWNSLGLPVSCVGHACLFFSIFLSMFDVFCRASRRRQLAEFLGSDDEENPWRRAALHSRHSSKRYATKELPDTFRWTIETWRDALNQRTAIGLLLAAGPAVAGFIEGTRSLNLTGAGSYFVGFSEVYTPLLAGSLESFFAGSVLWINRWRWDKLFCEWYHKACGELQASPTEQEEVSSQTDRQPSQKSGTQANPPDPIKPIAGETGSGTNTTEPPVKPKPETPPWGVDADDGPVSIPVSIPQGDE